MIHTTLDLVAVLLAAGSILIAAPTAITRLRRGHQPTPATPDSPPSAPLPDPGTAPDAHTPPLGRHRRPDGDLPAGSVSATGLLRRVRAEDSDRPALPRPTRAQLAAEPGA